jgi:putative transposase
MAWIPAHLTREQLEERRLEAARLLRTGKLSPAEIARQLGVSRAAVSQWAAELEAGGLRGLRRRRGGGRPSKLTTEQKRQLRQTLKRGAPAAGFLTQRWTLARVQQVIEHDFGISYHRSHLSRLLDQLNWSLQQPLPRALEREEAVIRAWLEHDWPRIKKGAATWRRHRVLR